MKFRHTWGRLVLLLSLAAALVVAVPVTLAFVTVQTPAIINTFGAPDLPAGDAVVDVAVVKTVTSSGKESIGPGSFHFLLTNVETGDEHIMTTDVTGQAQVRLAFYEEELGKTYRFTIAEVNDAREGVTYSEQVYELEITLALDDAKLLMPLCTLDGAQVSKVVAEFENLYTPPVSPVPPTGDSMNLWSCLAVLLACGAGLVLLRKKGSKLM